jgi:predicted transcriptional regulator
MELDRSLPAVAALAESPPRVAVLLALADESATPGALVRRTDLTPMGVDRALSWLLGQALVVGHDGRYQVTATGALLADRMDLLLRHLVASRRSTPPSDA